MYLAPAGGGADGTVNGMLAVLRQGSLQPVFGQQRMACSGAEAHVRLLLFLMVCSTDIFQVQETVDSGRRP